MSSQYGVFVEGGAYPFAIDDGPWGEPPKWLKSFRFEHEHIAFLTLHLWKCMGHPEETELRFALKATLRASNIKSVWAD